MRDYVALKGWLVFVPEGILCQDGQHSKWYTVQPPSPMVSVQIHYFRPAPAQHLIPPAHTLCPHIHDSKSVSLRFGPVHYSSLTASLCSSTIPPDPTMCSYVYCPHTQWQKCINIIKINISTFFIRCRMALCELYQILYSTGTGSQNPKSITEHILEAVNFLQEIKNTFWLFIFVICDYIFCLMRSV